MDQTVKQLGELLLGSTPTIVFLVLLYFFYRVLVHAPMAKVLAERHSLTEGAVERARADIAAAEAKTAEYENKFREASLAVFKAQEERRQLVVQAREAAVAEARAQAQKQVAVAKATLEQDKSVAQSQLQVEGERLANDVIRRVLQPMTLAPNSPAGGAR